MQIIIIETEVNGKIELAVENIYIPALARVFELSDSVKVFYINNMNVKDQQKVFNCGPFKKWISPIQQ